MSQFDDDFWSSGADASNTADVGGNNFDPVPDGTRCLVHLEDIEWGFFNKEGKGTECLKPLFCIESPSDYQDKKIQCNIKIYGDDESSDYFKPEKQEKTIENARKVYWAIDKNCGGKLAALGKMPYNRDLQNAWIGPKKSFYITFGLMSGSKTNWIRKVEPLSSGNAQPQSKPAPQKQAPKQQPGNVSGGFDDMDDDIPFN